ncbi:hypothetical protein [Caproiciproducens sp. LBM24188]|nr:hypothetical protein [Oscillospiraceae bacterium]HHV32293.1 hypothetical protein [Clostridiales bacterium]
MKTKKGTALQVFLVLVLLALIGGVGWCVFQMIRLSTAQSPYSAILIRTYPFFGLAHSVFTFVGTV